MTDLLLPQPLQEWYNALTEEAKAKSGSQTDPHRGTSEQMVFIRSQFHRLFVPDYDQSRAEPVQVVSTHVSKSFQLPVYYFKTDDGIEMWLRGNFYDWKISVRSEIPVPDIFYDLFDHELNHLTSHSVYFEGFEKAWIFGCYADNPQEFSLELGYDFEQLYTFGFLLSRSIRAAQVRRSYKGLRPKPVPET